MHMGLIPARLKRGDEIRVVAPARSLGLIHPDHRQIANERFETMGFKLSFGKHIEECDEFMSSAIKSRVSDLHAAFSDPQVKAVLTVIGGFNSNQLLKHLDFGLIRSNPKILCGYSDITALQNAIYARTGLVTYSGPHYSTFAMKKGFEFTEENFRKCLMEDAPFEVKPSTAWSDDPWYRDQEKREFIPNPGFLPLQEGMAEGALIGGNLCTLNLLHGTEFMPSLKDSILFIEDDELAGSYTAVNFDRDLQSVLHQTGADGIRGVVIGRFQKNSEMDEKKIRKIISSKSELKSVPVIANVDFGHTAPYITFPVGGRVRIEAQGQRASIHVLKH